MVNWNNISFKRKAAPGKRKAVKQAPLAPIAPAKQVTLTDEQNAVVEGLVKLDKQVQSLGGLAGSGKTTVVSYLTKRLNGFASCAFTGKAADVLRSKGVNATTIHSLIYDLREFDKSKSPVFELKDDIGVKGIIVDEASMVGRDVYDDLISFDVPIIFVGDHGQLEPVGEDLYLMANPDFRLEAIHRNAGDIAMFAHHLRNGLPVSQYPPCEAVTIVPKRECKPYLVPADQIICAKNVTRVALNRFLRELRGTAFHMPRPGDRVISLQNSKRLKIYNGTQGIVRKVTDRKLTIELPDSRMVGVNYHVDTFYQEKVNRDTDGHPFDYAYAVTCHKAQGSEWDTVLVLEQVCGLWDHKRWAYTAASRAKKKLIWVTED